MNKDRLPHPRALSNWQEARIAEAKLRLYVLNPAHASGAKGTHKARVFRAALGFDQSNWELLRDSILEELPYHEATLGHEDEYGIRYNVVLPITGPNGRTAEVMTAWIVRPVADHAELVTTLVIGKRGA
jgi:hypothetical protein